MIFDGDCEFCRFWVGRWHKTTDGLVDFIPSQAPSVVRDFPEIPDCELQKSVQLIETDGAVYDGAEAVLRSLKPKRGWTLSAYYKIPGARRLSESLYRLVANHRKRFATIQRALLGERTRTPD
jgi:predicted DCC family thiol-disulfide oxidoreductase YuxK